ncbi:MAG: sugar phosphate isomerase/epimerase [Bacteroidaceae bacterium]|nr:sugar phosphate isomerase/epimerase [Bacteroidaceae bacterium]
MRRLFLSVIIFLLSTVNSQQSTAAPSVSPPQEETFYTPSLVERAGERLPYGEGLGVGFFPQWQIGTTLSVFGGLNGLTVENLRKAKSAGVDCIEISLTGVVNGKTAIPLSMLKERMTMIKAQADSAGVTVWSIHMPYEVDCDPSSTDEELFHIAEIKYRKYLDIVSVLHPHIILFHPSFYRLEPSNREARMQQLARFMKSFNEDVHKIGAEIVIENMRGPVLQREQYYERALGRNISEMKQIMSLMPEDVYVAIDTNHATDAVAMIEAFGQRVHHLHISDTDGKADRHWLPGKGIIDWQGVIRALKEAHYAGPFMYELKTGEVTIDNISLLREIFEKYKHP